MRPLLIEKAFAIRLRKAGRSYSEILGQVPVSRGTLSQWLRNLPLTDGERKNLEEHSVGNLTSGRMKGAAAARNRGQRQESSVRERAGEMYARFRAEPLFHAGLTLWPLSPSTKLLSLTTKDADTARLAMDWLERYLGVRREDLRFRLYGPREGAQEAQAAWSRIVGVSLERIRHTGQIKGKRGSTGSLRIDACRVESFQTYRFWKDRALEEYRKQASVS